MKKEDENVLLRWGYKWLHNSGIDILPFWMAFMGIDREPNTNHQKMLVIKKGFKKFYKGSRRAKLDFFEGLYNAEMKSRAKGQK